jgi:DUF4097 and DUF4098 domain-containing protein YvlB
VPTTHHRFDTPIPITLDLAIDRGSVEVVAGDTAETTVDITTRHERDTLRVRYDEDGRFLEVQPEQRLRHHSRTDVVVRLPKGSRVELTTASASIDVKGPVAEAVVTSASGGVSLDEVGGGVEVTSASGGIRVREAGGDLSFQSASGSLKVERVGGECRARTASGSITIGRAGADVVAKTVSGSVRVGEAHTGTIDLHATSGGIGVGVRRGTLVWLDVSSVAGRVTSDLEGGDATPDDGEEPLTVRASSVSGSIQISSVGSASSVRSTATSSTAGSPAPGRY